MVTLYFLIYTILYTKMCKNGATHLVALCDDLFQVNMDWTVRTPSRLHITYAACTHVIRPTVFSSTVPLASKYMVALTDADLYFFFFFSFLFFIITILFLFLFGSFSFVYWLGFNMFDTLW